MSNCLTNTHKEGMLDYMPRRNLVDPETNLTPRQRNILFAIVKEYCDFGQAIGSKELKEKYGFEFSSATIRNELSVLRDNGYLYQPFLNSSSKPTEKAFKLFINQLIMGLQVTSKQQQDLKKQILEMEQKQLNLSKEISRLLALQSGGVGFSLSESGETIAGMKNLLLEPGEGKVTDILDFLDNIDSYKQKLLTSGETKDEKDQLKAIIGGEDAVVPLGKGYAMVTTEVFLETGEKSVIGLISPTHLLGKEKNIALVDAVSKALTRNQTEDTE